MLQSLAQIYALATGRAHGSRIGTLFTLEAVFVACFYAALLVFIAAGVVVLSRRTQRRRAPVAPIAVAFEPAIAVEHKREPAAAAQPVEAKPRSAQDLRTLVAMLHQRELAAEHRALSGKVDAVVADLPAVEAEERAWQDRRAVVAEMHEREIAAEHRAFAEEH
jgi:hypothetical protein